MTAVEKTASAGVILFVTSGTFLARLSSYFSMKILLVWTYGAHRVATEHLMIVRHKPDMAVSNGDILYGKGFFCYLIGIGLWLPSLIGFMLLAIRLLPQREQEALKGKYTASGPAILLAIALFYLIGLLPLKFSVLLTLFVLTLALLLPRLQSDLQKSV